MGMGKIEGVSLLIMFSHIPSLARGLGYKLSLTHQYFLNPLFSAGGLSSFSSRHHSMLQGPVKSIMENSNDCQYFLMDGKLLMG